MLVVIAVVLHEVLRYYGAPVVTEFSLLTLFTATFTILAFFVGVLLFDYQVERTGAERKEQIGALLAAEMAGISEGLDRTNAMEVRLLPDGPAVEVVLTQLRPAVVEEAVRGGFFDLP